MSLPKKEGIENVKECCQDNGESSMNKLVSILLVATALTGCSQGTSAQTQEDVAKLRMAALVLKYVDACENKSVPTYYVDKAQKIWSQATEADRKDVKAQVDAIPH